MCSGDVGHREPFMPTLVVQELIQGASRAVPEVQPRIRDRDGVEPRTRYPSLLAVIPALRRVRLEEEPIGGRIGVVGRRQILGVVTVLGNGFGREDGTYLLQEGKRALAGR